MHGLGLTIYKMAFDSAAAVASGSTGGGKPGEDSELNKFAADLGYVQYQFTAEGDKGKKVDRPALGFAKKLVAYKDKKKKRARAERDALKKFDEDLKAATVAIRFCFILASTW